MAEHAMLGASGASRWMACPGSIRLIKALPAGERDRTSSYADEGTAAHKLGEMILRGEAVPTHVKGKLASYPVTDEMRDAVMQYVDDVRSDYLRFGEGAVAAIETRVYPVPGRKDMFGTADAAIVQPFGELVVNDFKYGKGITVGVENNDQGMYYALGVLRMHPDCDPITIKISQPRVDHPDGAIREWKIPAEQLLDWGDTLEAAALLTADPKAPLKSGDHCRFCPAAARCPELRESVMQKAELDLMAIPADPAEAIAHLDLTDIDVLRRLASIVPVMEFLSKQVMIAVQTTVEMDPEAMPEFKLVRKGTQRRWIDPADVERRLRNKRGVSTDHIYKKTLQTPAQIEKIAGVGKLWVKKRTEKPDGALTVVRSDDKRPAEVSASKLAAIPATTGVDEPDNIF